MNIRVLKWGESRLKQTVRLCVILLLVTSTIFWFPRGAAAADPGDSWIRVSQPIKPDIVSSEQVTYLVRFHIDLIPLHAGPGKNGTSELFGVNTTFCDAPDPNTCAHLPTPVTWNLSSNDRVGPRSLDAPLTFWSWDPGKYEIHLRFHGHLYSDDLDTDVDVDRVVTWTVPGTTKPSKPSPPPRKHKDPGDRLTAVQERRVVEEQLEHCATIADGVAGLPWIGPLAGGKISRKYCAKDQARLKQLDDYINDPPADYTVAASPQVLLPPPLSADDSTGVPTGVVATLNQLADRDAQRLVLLATMTSSFDRAAAAAAAGAADWELLQWKAASNAADALAPLLRDEAADVASARSALASLLPGTALTEQDFAAAKAKLADGFPADFVLAMRDAGATEESLSQLHADMLRTPSPADGTTVIDILLPASTDSVIANEISWTSAYASAALSPSSEPTHPGDTPTDGASSPGAWWITAAVAVGVCGSRGRRLPVAEAP